MENDRKKRLYALKEERQSVGQSASTDLVTTDIAVATGATEGDDINKFLKDIVQRKKQRKKQLEIIHDFFENPAAYGIDTDLIPSSTTTAEVDERKKDLTHKIDLLRSVLKALEGEMQMLCQMKQADEVINTAPEKPAKAVHTKSTRRALNDKTTAKKKIPHKVKKKKN